MVVSYIITFFFVDTTVQLRDQDYLKLQFLGARDAWLGCPDDVCDLRMCPSRNNNYIAILMHDVGEKSFK